MLRFSKKVEYALIAMMHIADKAPGELTTARELSDKYDISLELMGKLLQSLVRYDLITSVQGAKGGYFLRQSKDEVKVGTIISAVDGPIQLAGCIGNNGNNRCVREKLCNIKPSIEYIQLELNDFFNSISLKDFKEKNNIS